MGKGTATLTGGQSSRSTGIVSGFVLKLARQSAGLTQEKLAESLNVDATTVQGWESGRRPVAAMPAGEFVRVCTRLTSHGAPPSTGKHLYEAIEADQVLATGIAAGERWIEPKIHPLGATVHRRSITNLITWPITGYMPPQLREFKPKVPRRGPTPTSPSLYHDERMRFFDHMVTVAERGSQANEPLLKRQAVYLLGFDRRDEITEWLRTQWQHAGARRIGNRNIPALLEARSASIALASAGDGSYLHHFVTSSTDSWAEIADLNYWAYWIGELPDEQADDSFMLVDDPQAWAGGRLLRHLAERLEPRSPHLPLNLHSLYSLLASRPTLLDGWKKVHGSLPEKLDKIESSESITRKGRDQVAGIHYALRIADH